mgnify:CR=1 FL=1
MGNIERELEEIIKDDGNDTWQNRAIKTLALALLETRKDIDSLQFKINIVVVLLSSILVMLVVNVLR